MWYRWERNWWAQTGDVVPALHGEGWGAATLEGAHFTAQGAGKGEGEEDGVGESQVTGNEGQ